MAILLHTKSEYDDFLTNPANKGKLMVIIFHASWCPPCESITPTFEELAVEHAGKACFGKIDIDVNAETAGKCKIRAMPTFHFYRDNEKVKEFPGANEEKLKQTIIDLLAT